MGEQSEGQSEEKGPVVYANEYKSVKENDELHRHEEVARGVREEFTSEIVGEG